MIRVGTDKRRVKSAELLTSALIKCMDEKDFSEVTVSDLQRTCGVSRATFYRLFDNLTDILSYRCQTMAAEIAENYSALPEYEKDSFMMFTLRYWLNNYKFLEAVFSCGRADILENALIENSDFIASEFSIGIYDKSTLDYIASASMGILSSILFTWIKHNKQETPEQLITIFRGFGKYADILLNQKHIL